MNKTIGKSMILMTFRVAFIVRLPCIALELAMVLKS